MSEPLTSEREQEIRAARYTVRSNAAADIDIDDLLAENEKLRARVTELEAAEGEREYRAKRAVLLAGIEDVETGGAPFRARRSQELRDELAAFVTESDRVVAYRNSHRPDVLLCQEHGAGWVGLTPLTSEDLPDGGLCTECDVDVLIALDETGGAS